MWVITTSLGSSRHIEFFRAVPTGMRFELSYHLSTTVTPATLRDGGGPCRHDLFGAKKDTESPVIVPGNAASQRIAEIADSSRGNGPWRVLQSG